MRVAKKKDQCIIRMYIYIPGTCLSSILVVEPSKTRSFPSKQGPFGFQVHIYIYIYICIYIYTYIYFRWSKTTPAHRVCRQLPPMASPPCPAPGRQHSDFHPLMVWKLWIPQWRNSRIWRRQHVKIISHIKIGIFTDPWNGWFLSGS